MIDYTKDLFPYQIDGVNFLADKKTDNGNAGQFDEMGLGKAQPIDAQILTPSGWKNLGEIKKNDVVFGSAGKPIQVLGIYPQGIRDVFKVTFNDGASTECCAEHLWQVNTAIRRDRGQTPYVLSLEEIRKRLFDINGNRLHFIPMVAPIQFETKKLPIDPYLLGVLLGDGGIKYASVVLTSTDHDLVAFAEAGLPDKMVIKKTKEDITYRIVSDGTQQINVVRRLLNSVGLKGCGSDTKFIPQEYFTASVEQRLALLQGLLDTDGYISVSGVIQFSSNSFALASGVAELAMSLGANARHSQKISASGKNHYLVTLSFPNGIIPFKIARKLSRFKPRQKYKPTRAIASVKFVGKKQTLCIKVDSQDNLYVTDNYILTHNTGTSIRAADKLNKRRLLIVCPAIARVNWQRELSKWQLIPRTSFVIKSSRAKIPPVDVLIVSYDLLQSQDFREAISEMEFDILIADEAQAVKNRKAARTKALYGERMDGSGIVSQAKRVWIMTGTPMPNNASELYTHLRALAPDRIRTEDGRLTYTQFVQRFCYAEYQNFGTRVVERIKGNRNVEELRRRLNGFFIRRKKEDVLKDLPPLQWGTVVLEPNSSYLKEINALSKSGKEANRIATVMAAAAAQHGGDSEMADKMLSLLSENAMGLSTLRRLLGLAKVEPTVDFIKNEMESTNKMILFCYHRELITQMEQALQEFKPVSVTGDNSPKQRQTAIDSFQNDPETRLFIGQISATNSAITLTSSDYVLLMEPSWTPAENVQAAARSHRIGQKSACVLAKYVVLAGSLDETIVSVLLRKSRQISEIMF